MAQTQFEMIKNMNEQLLMNPSPFKQSVPSSEDVDDINMKLNSIEALENFDRHPVQIFFH